LTEELAAFLAASRWQDIPASIRREGARAILNIAGCIVAGREDPGVGILARTFPGEDALLDAAAATAHDYDDTHLRTVIHATPPVAGVLFSWPKRGLFRAHISARLHPRRGDHLPAGQHRDPGTTSAAGTSPVPAACSAPLRPRKDSSVE
jgi:hypothetical protein